MENAIIENRFRTSFALRKIPLSANAENEYILTDSSIDKIKIIELSSAIDKWEQYVLFGDKGFYSLKGREVENKVQEFTAELKRFIDYEINKIHFANPESIEIIKNIKQQKILDIKTQMELYSQEQLSEWEISVYENALNISISRAVLYKNNPVIIQLSFQNGLKILETIANKEQWNSKLFKYKKDEFVSNFHVSLINEFIKEKDIAAYQYFEQHKEKINSKEKGKLEKQVNEMRINIIANNWAKEVFSYNLNESEYEKELKNIKDEEIKVKANQFYNGLKKSDKHKKLLEEKEKNIENWKEVMDFVQKDIDKADLYIDYSLNTESIKQKKEYIRQMRETGSVKTNIKEFLKLFDEVFSDFNTFKQKDISDYIACLSQEDFNMLETIQKYNLAEYVKAEFDCKLNKKTNIRDEEKYNLIRMYFISVSEYRSKNKDKDDLEFRKKLMELIMK